MAKIGMTQKKTVFSLFVFGDSLTDTGNKNGEFHKFRNLPMWLSGMLLGHSPWEIFSNGPTTWAGIVALEFEYQQRLQQNFLSRKHFKNDIQCWAQGGATAYNYNSLCSYFKFPKKFYARPFITHLGAETKKAYAATGKRSNSFEGTLVLNMIGVNDLLTIGYMDEGGVARAIQSIKEFLDFIVLMGGRNVYLANMPDITLTPRYHDKTDEKKKQTQTIINSFNHQLKDLVNSYQKHKNTNFEPYNADIVLQKDDTIFSKKKAFIIRGQSSKRKVLFCQDQKFLEDDNGHYLAVDVQLSKKQWKLLEDPNQVNNDEIIDLKHYIKRRAISKAKLNCNVRLFDAHTLYQKIYDNPEENGFTIGCALYTSCVNDEAIPEILVNIGKKSKNAIILQEITNTSSSKKYSYRVHYIKEGQSIQTDNEKVLFLKQENPSYQAMQKIYQETPGSASQEEVLITDCSKLRDPSIGRLISYALNKVMVNGQPLHLADVSISLSDARKNSGLSNAKRGQPEPAGGCLSWDDVHPTQEVHAILAENFIKEIEAGYNFREPKLFLDDMNDELMPKDPNFKPFRFQEAPDDISAWRKSTETIAKQGAEGSFITDLKKQLEASLPLLVDFYHKLGKQINKLEKELRKPSNNTQKIIEEKLNALNTLKKELDTHGKAVNTHCALPEFHQIITRCHQKHKSIFNKHRNSATRFFSEKIRPIRTHSSTLIKNILDRLSHQNQQKGESSSIRFII